MNNQFHIEAKPLLSFYIAKKDKRGMVSERRPWEDCTIISSEYKTLDEANTHLSQGKYKLGDHILDLSRGSYFVCAKEVRRCTPTVEISYLKYEVHFEHCLIPIFEFQCENGENAQEKFFAFIEACTKRNIRYNGDLLLVRQEDSVILARKIFPTEK